MKPILMPRKVLLTSLAAAGLLCPSQLMAAQPVLVQQVQKLTKTPPEAPAWFGQGTSLSGDTMVIGAGVSYNERGRAFIYQRSAGGEEDWVFVRELVPSYRAVGLHFGQVSDISGQHVRRIGNPHATPPGGFEIDRIVTHPVDRDDLQPGERVDQRRIRTQLATGSDPPDSLGLAFQKRAFVLRLIETMQDKAPFQGIDIPRRIGTD